MKDLAFRNVFLKTLRDNRAGILGWGTGLGMIMLIAVAQYPQIFGGSTEERARMVAEMTKAFQSFSFMTGEVNAIGTLGGFITTRGLGVMPMLLAFWVVIVASGLIRGEEQQGTMEGLLATPQSRVRVFIEKAMALLVAILAATGLMGLGLWAGVPLAGENLDTDDTLAALLNVVGLLAFWGAVGLLAGQLTISRRQASGIVGALVFVTYTMNNIFEDLPGLNWLAWLMPFHYYTRSKPLVPGQEFNLLAWLALIAFAAIASALALAIFTRRDIGAAFALSPRRQTAIRKASRGSTAMLGSVFGKALRDLSGQTLAWGLGIGLFSVVIVATTQAVIGPMQELAKNSPLMGAFIGNIASNEGYLSISLFNYLPALLAVLAIVQVEAWTSDEEEGRLGMEIAMPVPRWQTLMVRYTAITVAVVAILAVVGAFTLASAATMNIALSAERTVLGLLSVLPIALSVAAFGLFLATWLPRSAYAVTITAALVVFMFLMETLGPIFRLSDAVLNLSIFHVTGKPLGEGMRWGGFAALWVAVLLLIAMSLAGLRRRDLAK